MIMEIGGSREQVTEALETLKSTYDSFPIHQMSVSVDQDTYEHAVERCERGVVDASVRVRHDDSVLVIEDDEVEQTPRGTIDTSDVPIETGTRRFVKELTGVSCHVVDLASASIVSIRDTSIPDREPIYTLSVLFDAVYETGTLNECAAWDTSMPQMQVHQIQE